MKTSEDDGQEAGSQRRRIDLKRRPTPFYSRNDADASETLQRFLPFGFSKHEYTIIEGAWMILATAYGCEKINTRRWLLLACLFPLLRREAGRKLCALLALLFVFMDQEAEASTRRMVFWKKQQSMRTTKAFHIQCQLSTGYSWCLLRQNRYVYQGGEVIRDWARLTKSLGRIVSPTPQAG